MQSESAQIDPKKEVLDPNLKQRIQMFFGIENQEVDLSDINFTVKISSIVETNMAQEKELNDILKSAIEDEEEAKEGEEREPSSAECLRKAKLSN